MAIFLQDKKVKTRKPHKCYGCERQFPAGTKLQYYFCISYGDAMSIYICPVCEKVAEEDRYNEDEYSEGDIRYADNDVWESYRKEIEGESE